MTKKDTTSSKKLDFLRRLEENELRQFLQSLPSIPPPSSTSSGHNSPSRELTRQRSVHFPPDTKGHSEKTLARFISLKKITSILQNRNSANDDSRLVLFINIFGLNQSENETNRVECHSLIINGLRLELNGILPVFVSNNIVSISAYITQNFTDEKTLSLSQYTPSEKFQIDPNTHTIVFSKMEWGNCYRLSSYKQHGYLSLNKLFITPNDENYRLENRHVQFSNCLANPIIASDKKPLHPKMIEHLNHLRVFINNEEIPKEKTNIIGIPRFKFDSLEYGFFVVELRNQANQTLKKIFYRFKDDIEKSSVILRNFKTKSQKCFHITENGIMEEIDQLNPDIEIELLNNDHLDSIQETPGLFPSSLIES